MNPLTLRIIWISVSITVLVSTFLLKSAEPLWALVLPTLVTIPEEEE